MMKSPSSKSHIAEMVGQTKAVVLKDYQGVKDIMAFAIFDQKLVYFLSTVVEELI